MNWNKMHEFHRIVKDSPKMESMGQPDQTRRILSPDSVERRVDYKRVLQIWTPVLHDKAEARWNGLQWETEREDKGELRSGKSLLLYLVRAIWPKNRRFKWRLAKWHAPGRDDSRVGRGDSIPLPSFGLCPTENVELSFPYSQLEFINDL